MNLTDFYFLVFFSIALIVYYLAPRKLQWGVILVGSIAFCLADGHPALALYPVLSSVLIYALARLIVRSDREEKASGDASSVSGTSGTAVAKRRVCLVTGIVSLVAILVILKYLRFAVGLVNPEASESLSGLLVPLGLSYYTFTLISYLVDVYNGIATPETNLLRFMAFGMYAPTLVSGPIMQYRLVSESFYAEHGFDPAGIARGMQRMLWGFFKKLVIAERLSVIVAAVYADPVTFSGRYVWLAIVCFTIQLYADFSGLMDIVLGISQCLGIRLPENFDTPFFSKTIAELWRRWHITLGVWFKEYVFYPLLRTRVHTALQNRLKTAFTGGEKKAGAGKNAASGKTANARKAAKRAKRISTYIAMLVLWFTIGLWHGANMTFVIGSGLLQWVYIVLEETLEQPFKKLWERLHVNPANRFLEAVRMIRTFMLFALSMTFFRASSVSEAIRVLGCGFGSHTSVSVIRDFLAGFSEQGIRIMNDVSVFGLTYADIFIVIASLIILLAVDIYKNKTKGDIRDAIAARPVVLRFIIWYALLFCVILLGRYGPGYSAAEFIYQGF